MVILMIVSSLMPWRKVEAAVQPGWAKLLQNVKVKDGKSREAKVVGGVLGGRAAGPRLQGLLEVRPAGRAACGLGDIRFHHLSSSRARPRHGQSPTSWLATGATPGPAPAPIFPSLEKRWKIWRRRGSWCCPVASHDAGDCPCRRALLLLRCWNLMQDRSSFGERRGNARTFPGAKLHQC